MRASKSVEIEVPLVGKKVFRRQLGPEAVGASVARRLRVVTAPAADSASCDT
jgi:hypothetical protein